MPRSPESRGTCSFCGEIITRRGVLKHLEKCSKWQEHFHAAEISDRPIETLWHLRVQDAQSKDYWLELEMAGSATLDKLDKYLRAIWLECCGHLSNFTIGGWGGTDIAKSRKAEKVFVQGLTLRHLYDFGTTSETDIRVLGTRTGKAISKHPITLLARNIQPEAICQVCGLPANWLCIECLYEENSTGYLCSEHVQDHPHENYGEPMGIYNSPRTGMCGYAGPAEPPYSLS
jgi:hypothetical protein